jgi:hypothetical protein
MMNQHPCFLTTRITREYSSGNGIEPANGGGTITVRVVNLEFKKALYWVPSVARVRGLGAFSKTGSWFSAPGFMPAPALQANELLGDGPPGRDSTKTAQ